MRGRLYLDLTLRGVTNVTRASQPERVRDGTDVEGSTLLQTDCNGTDLDGSTLLQTDCNGTDLQGSSLLQSDCDGLGSDVAEAGEGAEVAAFVGGIDVAVAVLRRASVRAGVG
ncbi:MAG: hypothetical protein JWM72_3169 [Actinomycetia bacterium]|nr:hypothetical protein [Actinomycetes bacterium]